jgi:multidrug efflux pump subunit AcrA (membrane-fusion protein)
MFEAIIESLPELAKLESTVSDLERQHGEASARVQSLAHKTGQAREDDLNREAAALNAGRKPPNPTEPRLAEQLADAGRDAEVLQRRLALAQGEKARYLATHHATILGLLGEAHAVEGARVAAAAGEALAALLAYHRAEDDARNLQRLHPAPAPENTGSPQSTAVVWGALTTRNVTGGPNRGDLEGTLQYLISLGGATIVEAGAEEGEEDAA